MKSGKIKSAEDLWFIDMEKYPKPGPQGPNEEPPTILPEPEAVPPRKPDPLPPQEPAPVLPPQVPPDVPREIPPIILPQGWKKGGL